MDQLLTFSLAGHYSDALTLVQTCRSCASCAAPRLPPIASCSDIESEPVISGELHLGRYLFFVKSSLLAE